MRQRKVGVNFNGGPFGGGHSGEDSYPLITFEVVPGIKRHSQVSLHPLKGGTWEFGQVHLGTPHSACPLPVIWSRSGGFVDKGWCPIHARVQIPKPRIQSTNLAIPDWLRIWLPQTKTKQQRREVFLLVSLQSHPKRGLPPMFDGTRRLFGGCSCGGEASQSSKRGCFDSLSTWILSLTCANMGLCRSELEVRT